MSALVEDLLVGAAMARVEALIARLDIEGRLFEATPAEEREALAIEAFLNYATDVVEARERLAKLN